MPLSRRLVSLQGGLLQRQKWSDEQSAELGCHHPPKQSRCESLSVTKQIQTARVFLDVSRLCSMASNGKYVKKVAAQDLQKTCPEQIYFQLVVQPPKSVNAVWCYQAFWWRLHHLFRRGVAKIFWERQKVNAPPFLRDVARILSLSHHPHCKKCSGKRLSSAVAFEENPRSNTRMTLWYTAYSCPIPLWLCSPLKHRSNLPSNPENVMQPVWIRQQFSSRVSLLKQSRWRWKYTFSPQQGSHWCDSPPCASGLRHWSSTGRAEFVPLWLTLLNQYNV